MMKILLSIFLWLSLSLPIGVNALSTIDDIMWEHSECITMSIENIDSGWSEHNMDCCYWTKSIPEVLTNWKQNTIKKELYHVVYITPPIWDIKKLFIWNRICAPPEISTNYYHNLVWIIKKTE